MIIWSGWGILVALIGILLQGKPSEDTPVPVSNVVERTLFYPAFAPGKES